MSSYVCVCVCYCSHTLLHLSLSVPLYIPGTRHKLHNASPPLRCRRAKQRHPASRNTATEAPEEGRVFVYVFVFDQKVDRQERGMCPRERPRQQESGRLRFPGNDTGMFLQRESIPKLPQANGCVITKRL